MDDNGIQRVAAATAHPLPKVTNGYTEGLTEDTENPKSAEGLEEQLINQLVSRAKAGGPQLTKRLLESALDGEITRSSRL